MLGNVAAILYSVYKCLSMLGDQFYWERKCFDRYKAVSPSVSQTHMHRCRYWPKLQELAALCMSSLKVQPFFALRYCIVMPLYSQSGVWAKMWCATSACHIIATRTWVLLVQVSHLLPQPGLRNGHHFLDLRGIKPHWFNGILHSLISRYGKYIGSS